MNKPIVSIIIATFNAAKTLSIAMDSIMNQTFQDWECIIVDGASKDNTIEIVKSYIERDSRFRYISEPDKGIYDAFNKGLKMAKGEWVYYLGADDKLLADAFYILYEYDLNKYDVVYGDIILDIGHKMEYRISIPPTKMKGRMISHQSILMKRKLIEELGGFDLQYRVCADFDLVQKAILRNKLFFHFSPLYIAVFNCDGTSNRGNLHLKEAYNIHRKYKTINWLILCKIVYKYMRNILGKK